jgi:Zn-dependent peptidase ImmA (M78 family)
MFTLAHELAHIWLGRTALSDADARVTSDGEVESWCNRVAAELLVPMAVLEDESGSAVSRAHEFSRGSAGRRAGDPQTMTVTPERVSAV